MIPDCRLEGGSGAIEPGCRSAHRSQVGSVLGWGPSHPLRDMVAFRQRRDARGEPDDGGVGQRRAADVGSVASALRREQFYLEFSPQSLCGLAERGESERRVVGVEQAIATAARLVRMRLAISDLLRADSLRAFWSCSHGALEGAASTSREDALLGEKSAEIGSTVRV